MMGPFVSMGAMVLWASLLTPLPWWCFLLPSFLLWLYRAPGVGIKAKLDHGFGLDGAWIAGQWSFPGLGLTPSFGGFISLSLGLLLWGWSGGGVVSRVRPEVVIGNTHDAPVGADAGVLEQNIGKGEAMVQGQSRQRKGVGETVVYGSSEASNGSGDRCWSMDVWLSKRPFRRIP